MTALRTPLILMFVAAALAGGVYFVEFGRQTNPTANPMAQQDPALFGFKASEVKGLSIKTLATTVVLEKSSPIPPTWTLRSPQPVGPANEAIVAYLLNLLNAPRDRELKVPASRRAEFGFTTPLATIEFKLENQQVHTLILGKLNFDRTGLYAIVDPSVDPNADLSVFLVSTNFESAVNRPVAEWRSKPVKSSSSTASPAPQATVSPSASPSASPSGSPTPASAKP